MPKGVYKRSKKQIEHLGRISANRLGKKHSESHRIKISESKKGKPRSEETKRKLSEAHKGAKSHWWKGGKTINPKGYILIYSPHHPSRDKNNYVYEHRLVVEKQIGRYLKSCEQIHHLGKKNDNRPHMLMAFSNLSTHKKFESGKEVNLKYIIFDGRKLKNKGTIKCLV